jgi:hypothetical protein
MRTLPVGKLSTVRSAADIARIPRECACVVVTRGCHPAVAEIAVASASHAAENDPSGFRWYLISDETPADVLEQLERALHFELPSETYSPTQKDDEGAVPLVAVLLQPGANKRKYVMPLPEHSPEAELQAEQDAAAFVGGSGESAYAAADRLSILGRAASVGVVAPETLPAAPAVPLSPKLEAMLASVPYPSEIAEFVDRVAAGEVKPTYLGADAPLGDVDPVFPFLGVVVSDSWERVVMDPETDVVLEAYLTNCPMCMCLAPRLRMAAYAAAHFFPPSARVKVAIMNVDDNERPNEWMPGPAFPTIQLFNRNVGGKQQVFNKAFGAECAHLKSAGAASATAASSDASVATAAAAFESGHAGMPAHSHTGKHASGSASAAQSVAVPPAVQRAVATGPQVARTTLTNGPLCVPGVDFSHPTVPGKMALPSVGELVTWIARHCSTPFDPADVRVPAAALKGSAARFAAQFPPAPNAPSVPDAPAADGAYSLLELCADMDTEARVLEYGVFDLFYFEHLLNSCEKATGLKRAAADDRSHDEEAVPPTLANGHPEYNTAAYQAAVPAFREQVAALRDAVIRRGMYGNAEAAWDRMDAAAEFAEVSGLRQAARAYVQALEEDKVVFAALPLAKSLAADEQRLR